eukprot:3386683-Rhodomonas_salina.2
MAGNPQRNAHRYEKTARNQMQASAIPVQFVPGMLLISHYASLPPYCSAVQQHSSYAAPQYSSMPSLRGTAGSVG